MMSCGWAATARTPSASGTRRRPHFPGQAEPWSCARFRAPEEGTIMHLTRTLRADLETLALTTTPTRLAALEHVAPLLYGAWHDVLLEVDVAFRGSGGRLMLTCFAGSPDDPTH